MYRDMSSSSSILSHYDKLGSVLSEAGESERIWYHDPRVTEEVMEEMAKMLEVDPERHQLVRKWALLYI